MPGKLVETSLFNVVFILTEQTSWSISNSWVQQPLLLGMAQQGFLLHLSAGASYANPSSAQGLLYLLSACTATPQDFGTENFTGTLLLSLHVSHESPGLREPSWNSSSPSFPLARIFD